MERGRKLVVNFHGEEGFLTESKSLSLKALNLPSSIQRFHQAAHWIVEILRYNADDHKLVAKVEGYYIGHREFSPFTAKEEKILEELESIVFNELSTEGLFKTAGKLGKQVTERTYLAKEQQRLDFLLQKTISIRETVKVPIKELRFKLGAVSFKHKFEKLPSEIEVEIPNEHIREEFDAVKNYFAKILKTKRIVAKVNLELKGESIVESEVTSRQIAKITPELIEGVRFEFVRGFTKKAPEFSFDKSLFTMEEYLSQFESEGRNNPFYEDEQALFDDILNITKSKHYRQLRYLSQQHASHIMKLRFIQQPFSFIFLLEGPDKYHIIWETLNTKEATYIWHSDKRVDQLKRTLQKVEDIIKVVKVQGKIAYISSSEENYRRVFHDYSDLKDGFLTWKNEFESYLT